MGRVRIVRGRVRFLAGALTTLFAAARWASADSALPPPRHVTRLPGRTAPEPPETPAAAPAPAPVPAPAPAAPPAPPPPAPPTSPSPSSRGEDAVPREVPPIPEAVAVETRESTVRLTSTLTRGFPTDMDGDRGTLSLLRALVEVEGTIPTSSRFTWKWGAQAEMDHYQWSDVNRVVPGTGRLLDEGWMFRAGPGIEWEINDTFSVTTGIFGESALVSGVTFWDTLSFGGFATVRFRATQGLGVRLGVSARTNIGGSAFIVPIFGVDGGDTSKKGKGPKNPLRFSVRGSGCRLGYAFTESIGVGIAARYDRRDWRLAPDDRVPHGIVRDTRIPIGVDLEWTIRPGLSLDLEVGAEVYHEVEVDDRYGHRITIFEADPAPYLALSATWML